MNTRAAAAQVITRVADHGRSLDAALSALRARVAETDRALLQELTFGVLRWYVRLDALAAQLLRRPMKRRDRDLHALVLVGLYQLLYLRLPAYAAVTETVDAARTLGKPWAAGVINGVLRNAQRQSGELVERLDRDPAVALAHPAWLLESLAQDWPETWRAIAQANNTRAPMTLRINARLVDRDTYRAELEAAGLPCHSVAGIPSALELEAPVDVERLPGFAEGRVSVQDAAAQLAAFLLPVDPGMRVLDVCAAPGGKTAHLLEQYPRMGSLTAVDVDAQRLEQVQVNLARIGLEGDLHVGDATQPDQWWDGRPYERILVDAPCTATGVIRRHPDIKLLRRAGDVRALAARQAEILRAVWPLLAPGGILLYATCSVLEVENSQQIGGFLQRHPNARELAIEGQWGCARAHGRQVLPGDQNMDGFYYARLEKPR